MGIYIKGMEMPKSCLECPLNGESACKAFTTIEPWTFKDDERAAFCPLTEVPEPHGRLIDADKFEFIPLKEDEVKGRIIGYLLTKERIDQAPTVIERSETEE